VTVFVKCPTCGRKTEWSPSATFRPFCSDRCRLIDLGAWLSEQRSIPGDDATLPDEPASRDDDR
jgi:uncharacterized protein